MMKKWICLLLALAMGFGLAACGGGASSSEDLVGEEMPTESELQAEEPAASEGQPVHNVLTGEGPKEDASAGADSAASAAGSEAASQSQPAAAAPQAEYSNKRVTAVMVDNSSQARPQRGLADAEILVEILVEGGYTRFMALYSDYDAMPEVGPVRSGREAFLELVMAFQPLFVTQGESQPMKQRIADYDLRERILDHDDTIRTDETRTASGFGPEHSRYTSGDLVAAHVAKAGIDDERVYMSNFFLAEPYDAPPRALPQSGASSVIIQHSDAYKTFFDFDLASGKYAMSMNNYHAGIDKEPTIDENGGNRVEFDNVLVLFSHMPGHNAEELNHLKNVQYGNGVGYYFNGGNYERICWVKESPEHGLKLTTADGNETPVTVNPGTSYLAVVDVEWAGDFAFGAPGSEVFVRDIS